MRLLIAGGTGFLGSACARAAIGAGHDVTVLTRTGRNVTAGAHQIIADRCNQLPNLSGQFDAVIDTKAYQPAMVHTLTAALGTSIPYVFASSISVYDALPHPGMDETASATAATAAMIAAAQALPHADWCNLDKMGAHYGPLKRACEMAVEDWASAAASIHRLGLICGPGDKTDRLTWWIRTMDQGKDVPLPGPHDRSAQLIDVEDAALFMLHCAENALGGTFNVTGPRMPFAALLHAISAVAAAPSRTLQVPEQAIAAEGVAYWTDLPLVIPTDGPRHQMLNVSTENANASGLTIRPLHDTLARAVRHDRNDRERELIAGLTDDQRARLIAHHNPSG